MSVLHSLYYGNLNPADRPYAPNSTSADFRNLLKQQAEVGDCLNTYTDAQVQKWFFSYCELQAKISAAEQEELFAAGEACRTQYAENLILRRIFTFSPLSGVSPTAVSKAKIHPYSLHFRCKAV